VLIMCVHVLRFETLSQRFLSACCGNHRLVFYFCETNCPPFCRFLGELVNQCFVGCLYVCVTVQVIIHAVAQAIDVPLWVERQNIDLRICTYDRLYQDSVVIHNRSISLARIASVIICLTHSGQLLNVKLLLSHISFLD